VTEVLNRELALACSPAHAFAIFTGRTELWWPRGHRRDPQATMAMEPVTGGRLVERSPDGAEWVLGRITLVEPPGKLHFEWFPGSPGAPTSVEIAFLPAGGQTVVKIVHRALGEGAIAAWPDKVAVFARGWDTVLPALAGYIAENQETPREDL
jgi:uncharacterized protein YndB with AHSA1/START domain